MENTSQQNNANEKKGFLKSFKKKNAELEFYDASAMFIGQYLLQFMLQFALMLLANSILAYKLGVDISTQEGMNAVNEKFNAFTASTLGVIIVVLINETTMLLSPLAYWKIKSFNVFKGVGFTRKINGGQIAMTLPIAVGLLAGFMPIASLFVYLISLTGYSYGGADIAVDSFGKLVLYLIFVAALPAVCEEILHRGMVARGASRISIFVGIILSSTIFAFMHGSPVQLVHQFFVGAVCCLAYFMTGSIWTSVLTHFFNNALTLIGSYVLFLITGSTDFTMPWWGMSILCVCGLAVLVGCLIAMYKICYAKHKKEDIEYNIQEDGESVVCGKRKALKVFNEKLAYLYRSPEQTVEEKNQAEKINEELSQYSEEKKEVYYSMRRDEKINLRKKNSRGIIFALVVVIVLWIVNTLGGYI